MPCPPPPLHIRWAYHAACQPKSPLNFLFLPVAAEKKIDGENNQADKHRSY